VAVIGPTLSPQIVTILPLIKKHKIPMFVGGTAPRLTVDGGRFVFRLRPSDDIAASAIVGFLAGDLKVRKIGILHENDVFGIGGSAEIQQSARASGVDVYKRVERDYLAFQGVALLGHARVLLLAGTWDEAQLLLERALWAGDEAVAVEAAYRLGEGLRGAGRHQQAVDSYMTAAYVGPDTPFARRALLGAGQSFTALKQPDSAIIVYKKLLAGKSVEPDVADAAKKGLKALGVN